MGFWIKIGDMELGCCLKHLRITLGPSRKLGNTSK